MDYELLSNGNIGENYPKTVVFKNNLKVKHWMEFESVSDEGREDALTVALDDIIDFDKTKFIKSSEDLTLNDRKYLFLVQRIIAKGYEFSVRIDACDNEQCGKTFESKLSLQDLKEERTKTKFHKDDKMNLDLFIPTYKRMKVFNNLLSDYKENGGKYLDENKEFQLKCYEVLLKYPFIAKEGMGIDEYIDWVQDQDASILKYINNYILTTYHGFNRDVKVKCPHCNTMNNRLIPIDMSFFL